MLAHDIDPKRAAEYEQAVSRVMAVSEVEMLKLIPTRSGIMFCGCPNCSTQAQQEYGQFDWSIERPFDLRCRYCGHVYPSEKYPMGRTDTGTNMLGETLTYRYYLDEKSGRDFWFEAAADYLRRGWFRGQCMALARAYHVTRKPEYARRAALILGTWARAYPHMAVLSQWPYRRRQVAKPTPPFPHAGGKWGRDLFAEVPADLPYAYDLIYDSEELDRLSREQGADVRRRIENDFFRATIAYRLTFGKQPEDYHLDNLAYVFVRAMIDIGRVIGEPEYPHWAYRWVGAMVGNGFFSDGMWRESPSYHYQTIGGIRRVMQALKGYSDPPGYRSAAGGPRLDNVDLEGQFPVLRKMQRAPDLIAYPDGSICPVHDSVGGQRHSPVREESVSTLLPGFGHASLGAGRGANQIVAQLHFSGGYGHQHADMLNFSLFAKGAEMLSDLGYTHSKLRQWAMSTLAHNTVVVDRQRQALEGADGDLALFVPGLGGLSAVEARGERAYPGRVQVYRRTLLLVPISESDAYVVDVFRAKGGTLHDWTLHGSADADMTAECPLALDPVQGGLMEPGEKWEEPLGESSRFPVYGILREVKSARSDGPAAVTFRYVGGGGAAAPAGAGVRTHLLSAAEGSGAAGTEILLAKSPRVRQGGRMGGQEVDSKVYDFWMPQLIARRRGAAPLSSVFAAVHEPFKPNPFVREVRSLPLDPPSEFSVALEVQHGEFTDTIISTLDETPYPERKLANGITVRGRLAVVRERAGRVVAAWLVDGARLAKGDFALTLDAPRCLGVIESATRKADGAAADAFVTPTPLPVGDALAGQWMVVTHGNGYTHGYEIHRVEQRDGESVIVLRDDHGLRIKGEQTEELCFPRRKIAGQNRFVIAGQTTATGQRQGE